MMKLHIEISGYIWFQTFFSLIASSSHSWDQNGRGPSLRSGWHYEEQEKWPAQYCLNGISQSPIDLQTKSMIEGAPSQFEFKNWDQPYNMKVRNNGHTIQVTTPESGITVTGGGLPGIYNLVQFHFHWGSEHTIDGARKGLEAHFVTYNNKYSSATEAMSYKNGYAVLGVLYDIANDESRRLGPIINKLADLVEYNQSLTINMKPSELLPETTEFYRYDGSLTTPPCNDVVLWTIFTHHYRITKEAVDRFAAIKNEEGHQVKENYRKVQSLNSREVFKMCTNCNLRTKSTNNGFQFGPDFHCMLGIYYILIFKSSILLNGS